MIGVLTLPLDVHWPPQGEKDDEAAAAVAGLSDRQSTTLLDMLVARTCHSHRFLQHISIHTYQQTCIIFILLTFFTI